MANTELFAADGKRLDMSTQRLQRCNWLPNNFSLFFCKSFRHIGIKFWMCSNSSGGGWRIRINGSGAAGIKFEKIDAFKITPEDGTATLDADNDTLTMGGRIQNAGGSTMMAADRIHSGGLLCKQAVLGTSPIRKCYGQSVTQRQVLQYISHTIEATEVFGMNMIQQLLLQKMVLLMLALLLTPDFTSVTAAGVHQH